MKKPRSCAACRSILRKVVASAPGRVNLIGEHTDYNQGFVFPIATPQRTTVSATARDDWRVRVWSANVGQEHEWAEFSIGQERRVGLWSDYVQGVTMALRDAGWTIDGFEARIESQVPLGAGLSSSASLEVALIRALRDLFDLPIDEIAAARVAHVAETSFVGVPVGIMDQMAASLAAVDAALFLDTRSLEFERVPLPPSVELVVIDSGQRHEHAGGEYRTRRAECDEAARLLGVAALRDVDERALASRTLPAPLDRRVRHVVTENARVLAMRTALATDDAITAGELMNTSHRSMRDDFEVSTREIDRLVECATAQPGVFGARLTGGGFGGCIVVLAQRGTAVQVGESTIAAYAGKTRTAQVLIP